MSILNHKIDFAALVSVTMANSNGDPLNGNRPRTDYNGYGEMSDVCIKRKIRNRMQDLGNTIFVQSEDRCDDGFGSLSERASAVMKGITDRDEYAKKACETWLDVRTFGQVFAFKDSKGLSVGVRGPVSVHQAVSLSPVEIESLQITKSVNGEKKAKGEAALPTPWAPSISFASAFTRSKAPSTCSLRKRPASRRQMPRPSRSACARCL